LLVDEVDEAFANVYSTTMSVHNIVPQLDRRIIALIIGVTATLLAGLLNFGQYQSFPLLDRLGLRPAVRRRGRGLLLCQPAALGCLVNVPLRAAPVIAWACGFVVYQLVYPGNVPGWADFWTGSTGASDSSRRLAGSSVAAIAVSGSVMLISGLLLSLPSRRRDVTASRCARCRCDGRAGVDRASRLLLATSRDDACRLSGRHRLGVDTGVALGLECDVHFSADDELVCLHD
jgi:hypothetical protein